MEDENRQLITASQLQVAPDLQHLYQYLLDNCCTQEIQNYHGEYLKIFRLMC